LENYFWKAKIFSFYEKKNIFRKHFDGVQKVIVKLLKRKILS